MEKRLVLGCWISVLWRSDNFAMEQSVIFTLLSFFSSRFYCWSLCFCSFIFLFLISIHFFLCFLVSCLLEWVPFCFVCRSWSLFTPTHQPDYKRARCGFILLTDWESCHTHNTDWHMLTLYCSLPSPLCQFISPPFPALALSLCLSSVVSLL